MTAPRWILLCLVLAPAGPAYAQTSTVWVSDSTASDAAALLLSEDHRTGYASVELVAGRPRRTLVRFDIPNALVSADSVEPVDLGNAGPGYAVSICDRSSTYGFCRYAVVWSYSSDFDRWKMAFAPLGSEPVVRGGVTVFALDPSDPTGPTVRLHAEGYFSCP